MFINCFKRRIFYRFLVLTGFCFVFSTINASEETSDYFDILIAPTMMNPEMDAWYKTPPDSAPEISIITEIQKGQRFCVNVFFRNFKVGSNDSVDIVYDIVIKKPNGDDYDKSLNVKGASGEIQDSNVILLAESFIVVEFEPKDPYGIYTIIVEARDEVSGQKCMETATIELQEWTLGASPSNIEEYGKWVTEYYKDPNPGEAIYAYLKYMEIWDKEDVLEEAILYFFVTVFT